MEKFNYCLARIFAVLVIFIVFLGAFMAITSCATPNPRLQKKHYDKFIYYGGKIDTAERIVTVEKIVKGKDGKDSLIYIDVPVKCPEPKIEYKTKWYIKHLAKSEKDSLVKLYNHREKLAKIRSKSVNDSIQGLLDLERAKKKTAKAENRTSAIWIILAIVFGITTILLLWKNLIRPRLSSFL